MGAAFTEEDLVLLGYDDIKPIDVGENAIAFSGKAKAGIVQAEHFFVYIKTDATKEDLIKVAKKLQARENLYVLTSKSGPTRKLLKSTFGETSIVFQIEELLWARVSEVFRSYAENISRSVPAEPHFIAPRGQHIQAKDRLDQYLVEYFTKADRSSLKNLVVLKASAGVGKTTLSRQLVKEFARRINTFRVMPVYVEAAHWGGRVSTASDLWDIIQLSLQNFDTGSGISRSLFEAALKRGLILFIFDGFDELCSSPRSNISARETLEALMELAVDSDARIVLTTRTPYWLSEIGADPEEVYALNLLPFNPQQAKEYIRKFFEHDSTAFEAARQLYAEVISHANTPDNEGGAKAQFWSLPIAVSMICEAVKAGVSRTDWKTLSLENLLSAICERETKRQNLSITGARQLNVFKEIALLDSSGTSASFEHDDLLAAGVSDMDATKFNSHPLLRYGADGRYSFAYDFFGPFLRALAINELLESSDKAVPRSILDAMKAEENGKGFLLEHLLRVAADKEMDSIFSLLQKIPITEQAARSFAIHFLLRMADRQSDVVNSADRSKLLLRAIADGENSRVVRGVRLVGDFERLDLSDVEFVGCEFRDIAFKDVNFSGTIFRACKFDGEIDFSSHQDRDSFSETVIAADCELRGGARLALESIVFKDPAARFELIKDLLEAALSKFWHNGKFKSALRKADWKKGPLGRSRSSDALLEILKRNRLISETSISGVQEGGWIFNRDAIGDLQNFMDHRQMSGSILSAFNDLDKALGKEIR